MVPSDKPETSARTVPELPDSRDPVGAPRDREKAVAACLLRLLGSTQPEAAEAAGLGERTLRQYEACSWWADVQAEASRRWLAGLVAKARAGLAAAVEGDGGLALRVLERVVPELQPPRLKVDLSSFNMGELSDETLAEIAAGADPGEVLARKRGRP